MTTPDEDAAEAITAIEHTLAAAWVAGDCDGWAAHIAPEWSVTHIGGELLRREEVLRMCRAPDTRVASMESDDLEVRVFGAAAVATGRTTATTAGEAPQTMVLRFTDVFVHRDGRWLVVASHATQVAT